MHFSSIRQKCPMLKGNPPDQVRHQGNGSFRETPFPDARCFISMEAAMDFTAQAMVKVLRWSPKLPGPALFASTTVLPPNIHTLHSSKTLSRRIGGFFRKVPHRTRWSSLVIPQADI